METVDRKLLLRFCAPNRHSNKEFGGRVLTQTFQSGHLPRAALHPTVRQEVEMKQGVSLILHEFTLLLPVGGGVLQFDDP